MDKKPVDVEEILESVEWLRKDTGKLILCKTIHDAIGQLAAELKTVHESWQKLNRLYQGTCGLLRKAEAELKEARESCTEAWLRVEELEIESGN